MATAKIITRVFKTGWFTKAARKAHIDEDELCEALQEAIKGQADDLGGGVFKKRLNKNRHRSILLAKGGQHWVYSYLFAKKDLGNIADNDLEDFRSLAKRYAALTDKQIMQLVADKEWMEICNGEDEV